MTRLVFSNKTVARGLCRNGRSFHKFLLHNKREIPIDRPRSRYGEFFLSSMTYLKPLIMESTQMQKLKNKKEYNHDRQKNSPLEKN